LDMRTFSKQKAKKTPSERFDPQPGSHGNSCGARRNWSKPLSVCALSFLVFGSGCGQTGIDPLTETVDTPPSGIVLSRSSLNVQTLRDPQQLQKVCLGRGADTAYEHSESGGLSVSLVSSPSQSSESSDFQDNAGEEELAGRTPAVLMAREIFYRACEFSTNYQLTKGEATQIFHAALEAVGSGWSNESENTTVTVGDTVATSNSNNQNNGTSLVGAPSVPSAGSDTNVATASDTSTEEVVDIESSDDGDEDDDAF
jgi:hypothetical protein